jgi:hypothetical protein
MRDKPLTTEIDSRLIGANLTGGYRDNLKGIYRLCFEKKGKTFEVVITSKLGEPEMKIKKVKQDDKRGLDVSNQKSG